MSTVTGKTILLRKEKKKELFHHFEKATLPHFARPGPPRAAALREHVQAPLRGGGLRGPGSGSAGLSPPISPPAGGPGGRRHPGEERRPRPGTEAGEPAGPAAHSHSHSPHPGTGECSPGRRGRAGRGLGAGEAGGRAAGPAPRGLAFPIQLRGVTPGSGAPGVRRADRTGPGTPVRPPAPLPGARGRRREAHPASRRDQSPAAAQQPRSPGRGRSRPASRLRPPSPSAARGRRAGGRGAARTGTRPRSPPAVGEGRPAAAAPGPQPFARARRRRRKRPAGPAAARRGEGAARLTSWLKALTASMFALRRRRPGRGHIDLARGGGAGPAGGGGAAGGPGRKRGGGPQRRSRAEGRAAAAALGPNMSVRRRLRSASRWSARAPRSGRTAWPASGASSASAAGWRQRPESTPRGAPWDGSGLPALPVPRRPRPRAQAPPSAHRPRPQARRVAGA